MMPAPNQSLIVYVTATALPGRSTIEKCVVSCILVRELPEARLHVDRRRRALRIDLCAELGGVGRREQLRDRIVHENRIAEIRVAIGVRAAFRFGHVVQARERVPSPRREWKRRDDIENFAERDAAGTRRRAPRRRRSRETCNAAARLLDAIAREIVAS